ncbi:MAG: Fe-S cluster assembly protein SufD [Verrucomicrobiota bacterium]
MADLAEKPITTGMEPFITAAEALEQAEAGSVMPWLTAQRNAGLAQFAEAGFPGPKNEDWKYTSTKRLASFPVKLAGSPSEAGDVTEEDLAPYRLRDEAAAELVFVDGHYRADLSFRGKKACCTKITNLAEGIRATNQITLESYLGRHADEEIYPLAGLNTALFQDGAVINVGRSCVIHAPIHILHISTGDFLISPRVLVVAEPHSSAPIVETFASKGDGHCAFYNSVTEAVVQEGANLKHVHLNLQNQQSYHVGLFHSEIERDARTAHHSFAFGGALTRRDTWINLNEEGTECLLNGLYMPGHKQHIDHQTVVNHRKPHCESHEFFHGILNHKGRGVFNGKIFVQEGAIKTDAKQSNRAMLISPDAKVDTKPQLEIWNDDVKCTHGATIGAIDEVAAFYLRSRGIPEFKAREMLVRAFAEEIVLNVNNDSVREHIDDLLSKHLASWEE